MLPHKTPSALRVGQEVLRNAKSRHLGGIEVITHAVHP
jgi:hypothetical protein